MKKNTKNTFSRSFSILAAAALSMTLISGQAFPTYAGSTSGIEAGAVIPDNITIDSPTALSNVALPSNSYGTLSWVDSSYVPEKRVQSCAVVFKPSAGEDLSGLPGWDSSSGTLTGYVTVVVSSIDGSEESESDSSSADYKEIYDENEKNNVEASDESSTDSENTSGEEAGSDSADKSEISEDSDADSEQNGGKEDSDVTESPSDQKADDENAANIKNKDISDKEDGNQKDEVAETPEVTEIPDTTETSEITVTPSQAADSETTDDSEQDKDIVEEPEITETPEITAMPSVDDSASEDKDNRTETDEEDKAPETTEVPEVTETPEDNNNIFDRKDEEEDKRPQNAATDLTDTEKEQTAAQNHTCDGITVSGIDLPWYVQFRVSGGDDYEFTNEEDATIFKSYEFELWDTQNNTEYKIPDGEYISVTVPVKAGYTYSIEHLLDNGAMETIIPSVDGDTMTFSTHSFSPFGIAGSKSLVGPDAGSDSSTTVTPAADTAQSTSTTDADAAESADTDLDTSADLSSGSADLKDSSSQESSTSDEESEEASSQTTSKKQVNTGDTTQILPFVILFVAAAVVAGVVVFLKRRKK